MKTNPVTWVRAGSRPARRFKAMCALAACAWAASAAAVDCPTELPRGLKTEAVGDEMRVNGLPMNVLQVRGRIDAKSAVEEVRQSWTDAHYNVRRDRAGEWTVLSVHGEDCHTTLQLIDRNGAFGYLGVSQPAKARSRSANDFPVRLPGNIDIRSSVESTDSGRKSSTLAFSSERSLRDLDVYFQKTLMSDGWQSLSSHRVVRAGVDSRVISGQKGGDRLSLVMWDDAGTQGVVNVGEAP